MTNLRGFEIIDGRLKGYKGNASKLEIPSIVTAIDRHAFYLCASLEEVTLPNTVREIGFSAFKSCVNLKKINIPRSR
jgi:deoxycytidine triphosphate deaminase